MAHQPYVSRCKKLYPHDAKIGERYFCPCFLSRDPNAVAVYKVVSITPMGFDETNPSIPGSIFVDLENYISTVEEAHQKNFEIVDYLPYFFDERDANIEASFGKLCQLLSSGLHQLICMSVPEPLTIVPATELGVVRRTKL